MALSSRVKESIKTALAMTITYAIALSLGWERPYWAGFAVAFVSLSSLGQSYNKAAMRIFGTLLAVIVALFLIALFPQQRWMFMVALSAWVGLCTYLMGGKKHQYVWNVCGFVTVIICMDAGPDPVSAFHTAILRAQETGLGIAVYSVVALLLWPSTSRDSFDASGKSLVAAQHRLINAYRKTVQRSEEQADLPQLRVQLMQHQAQFNQLLDAAESDSYEVWELRQQWRHCQTLLSQIGDTLEHWNESAAGLLDLHIVQLLPSYREFGNELDQRFGQIESMLAGNAPTAEPSPVDLTLDEPALKDLSPFSLSALVVARGEMQELDSLSNLLFSSVSDLKGFGKAVTDVSHSVNQKPAFSLDPDRLWAVGRVVLTMWLAYLSVLYINDIPGGYGLVGMAAPMAMIYSLTPQLAVRSLFLPVGGSILFGGLVYILVMPTLSSFMGLGLVIFASTFAICYLFSAPAQMLPRAIGLAMFLTIAAISNEQSYSFIAVANTGLMFCAIFVLLAITACFPLSPRPEAAMLRLLKRFFGSAHSLTNTTGWGVGEVLAGRNSMGQAFHLQQVSTVPAKLSAWVGPASADGSPDSSAELQALVTSLQTLSYRTTDLLELRCNGKLTEQIPQQLRIELDAWHGGLRQELERLSRDPSACEYNSVRIRLDMLVDSVEACIRQASNSEGDDKLAASEAENLYRLLGAFRSVSEALVGYARTAEAIHWAYWHEERFT